MRTFARLISILLGIFTGYLSLVGISGLAVTPFGLTSGPLVMRIGGYGVTSQTFLGYLVCAFVTAGLITATWALLCLVPTKLVLEKKDQIA